jgi:hypothetical protein
MIYAKVKFGLLLVMIATLGLAACASEARYKKIEPAELVDQGDGRNLVILTEKAAERLDIRTDIVREEELVIFQTFGGQVTEADPATGSVVMVSLTPQEMSLINPNEPARIRTLDVDDSEDDDNPGFPAELDEKPGLDDDEDDEIGALNYKVNGNANLVPGQRLIVEVILKSDEGLKLVVPFASLLYDIYGETYVYIETEPLQYLRVPVIVNHIEGDTVFLDEGPEAGVKVVTVGAVELFGTDTGVGK